MENGCRNYFKMNLHVHESMGLGLDQTRDCSQTHFFFNNTSVNGARNIGKAERSQPGAVLTCYHRPGQYSRSGWWLIEILCCQLSFLNNYLKNGDVLFNFQFGGIHKNVIVDLSAKLFRPCQEYSIHVIPPGSCGRLPDLNPISRTPARATQSPAL